MICPQCNKEFTATHWTQKYCVKNCYKEYQKKNKKKYMQTDKYKATVLKYRSKNLDKLKKYTSEYQQSDKGIEAIKRYTQSDKGKETIRKYVSTRRKTDPIFKLAADVRKRLRGYLRASKITKTNSTFKMVGCTPEFLKEYLEKKFYSHPITNKPMTWKNHTTYGWHVDHVKPLNKAKTLKAVEKLMYYTNLQPLWAIDNMKKGDKY